MSQEELIALQNENLKQGNIKFLQSLQPDAEKVYGIKNKPREDDPAMKDILHWGYEAPCRNDYIKDKRELMYKIRKMDKECISESKDNFRKPEYVRESGTYLFNFMGQDSQDQWKKRLYDMAVEGESDELKKTMYQVLFCGAEKAWWDSVFRLVTPAGKRCLQPVPSMVVTPMDFLKQKIEEKIRDILEK